MADKEKQQRRQYAKRGERSGKMMSFRVDDEVLKVLNTVKNKGRLLNDLVRCWSQHKDYDGDEVSPKEWDIEDYFT